MEKIEKKIGRELIFDLLVIGLILTSLGVFIGVCYALAVATAGLILRLLLLR
jgi:hypothetical protein